MFVHSVLVVGILLDVLREPLREFVVRVEEGRHDEMEESPKFVHRILNRSTGEKESISTTETEESLPSSRTGTLDRLRFVENHVLPLDLVEVFLVGDSLESSFEDQRGLSR